MTGTGQGTLGSICGETIPAGPPLITGEEIVPMDLPPNAATGASPQTAMLPYSSLGLTVNRIIGGDFTTNLWQRGTSFAAISPTTYQMTADRWFAVSASNTMTVSKQTPATTAADYIYPATGIASWMRVARPSGTPSGSSCVGQILDQRASASLVGNNAVFSFYGYAPTTFSATGYVISATIAYYTAADSATAGTNTATYALSASGQTSGITGYTAATSTVSSLVAANGGSITSGVASVPLSVTPTRYSVAASIPSANSSGTQVIGVGVSLCATPTATTTVSTDYFEFTGAQLEAKPSTVTAQFPAGVVTPSPFQLRFPSDEARLEQAYSYVLTDGAATQRYGMGQALTTGTAQLVLQFPTSMRETPTLTVGTTISFGVTQAAGTAQACATSIAGVAASYTPQNATFLCTTGQTNLVAGNATEFTGAATAGIITASAEP